MSELEQLAREVQEQLGEPSEQWLRAQQDHLRQALATQPRNPRAVSVGWAGWAWGAALATVMAAALWWLVPAATRTSSAHPDVALSAESAERVVPLADGSVITLAAHSRAQVQGRAEGTRCLLEVGTLSFDVTPQRGRKFWVVAGDFEVSVVGTRFSVSRDAGGKVEVRVQEGVVRVQTPDRGAALELRAGDRLRGAGRELELTRGPPTPSASTLDAPPSAPSASSVATLPGTDAVLPAPTASSGNVAEREEWRKLYRARDYAGALAAARAVGTDRLLESLGVQALAELADAARLGGDRDLALRAFSALGRRFPQSPQAEDALFLGGRVLASQGRAAAARARLEEYLARTPQGTYAVEATGRLVELYATSGDARAKATAKAYLQLAPNGPYRRLCHSVLAAP